MTELQESLSGGFVAMASEGILRDAVNIIALKYTTTPNADFEGAVLIYAKSDGNVYKLTPEGVESLIG